jgi:hypothetical protein
MQIINVHKGNILMNIKYNCQKPTKEIEFIEPFNNYIIFKEKEGPLVI